MTGAPFIPRLGLQSDEAIYASALLPPRAEQYSLELGHYRLPLMVMNYLGTLKAVLYRQMIRAFGTGLWATRIPMLLAGAASIWLFYWFLRRVAGERAAVIGSGLLAVDSMYMLTACFDWGPVALQHLLVVGGLLLLMKFRQEHREWALAGGFFLFGLALWDKALASWILGGMAVASILIFPRQILGAVTVRRLAVAVLAFALGALPLIIYNVNTGGATFQGTVAFEHASLPHKLEVLWLTVNGSGLYGTFPYQDSETAHPHLPQTPLERVSSAVASITGNPQRSLLFWAFGAALVLAALARGPELRAIFFALASMALAWGQMAFTAGAGASVHHTILLWPLPQMVIGISFAAASRRLGRAAVPALAAVMVILMGWSLAVTNEYYALLVRNGPARDWTDAIFSLSNYLKKTQAREIFAVDWGIMDSLRLLNRGRLSLGLATTPIDKPELTAADRDYLTNLIVRPDHLFIAHAPGLEFFQGLNDKLVRFAGERGYRQKMLAVISDSYQRPTFEVYSFVRGDTGDTSSLAAGAPAVVRR